MTAQVIVHRTVMSMGMRRRPGSGRGNGCRREDGAGAGSLPKRPSRRKEADPIAQDVR